MGSKLVAHPKAGAVISSRPGQRPGYGLDVEAIVSGHADEGFGAIADEFRRNLRERNELGAACAVVVDGTLAVDLWGGHRDRRRTKPWTKDTLVTVFSTSKGMAATALAVAHSRGLFDLETTVASYWPEFAESGKEAITVRQLPAHDVSRPADPSLRTSHPAHPGSTGNRRWIAQPPGR